MGKHNIEGKKEKKDATTYPEVCGSLLSDHSHHSNPDVNTLAR